MLQGVCGCEISSMKRDSSKFPMFNMYIISDLNLCDLILQEYSIYRKRWNRTLPYPESLSRNSYKEGYIAQILQKLYEWTST